MVNFSCILQKYQKKGYLDFLKENRAKLKSGQYRLSLSFKGLPISLKWVRKLPSAQIGLKIFFFFIIFMGKTAFCKCTVLPLKLVRIFLKLAYTTILNVSNNFHSILSVKQFQSGICTEAQKEKYCYKYWKTIQIALSFHLRFSKLGHMGRTQFFSRKAKLFRGILNSC